jgi:hypothetical protein
VPGVRGAPAGGVTPVASGDEWVSSHDDGWTGSYGDVHHMLSITMAMQAGGAQ